ncbi:MAG: DUF445 family protein [Pseudomonadales bacterium]|nr:DUF445 family protein [Pseudomonadales bacterium]
MDVITTFLEQPNLYQYLAIPFISALVGWITNAIGIQMMFKPEEFIGIRPIFGWQGIVPARAGKFARLQMEQMEKIIDMKALFDRIDPEQVARHIRPGVNQLAREMSEELLSESMPFAWENTPNFIKNRFYKRLEKELPYIVEQMYSEVRNNFDNLFDAKSMVVDKLSTDKHILNELIHQTIHKELNFLVKSGLYFGFLFGLIQMVFWYFNPDIWYVLPLGGFAVGYLTNWIAVKLMFRPIDPIKIGPFTLHGLFLKRKDEVAGDYAATMTEYVLSSEHIAQYILKSEAADKIYKLISKHLKKTIDNSMGLGKPLVLMSIGTQRYIDLKNQLCERIANDMQDLPPPMQAGIAYTEQAMGLENEITERMKAFTSLEFDGFVRPVFEEDEWILYAVGGGLGFIAGWCQFVLMFQ